MLYYYFGIIKTSLDCKAFKALHFWTVSAFHCIAFIPIKCLCCLLCLSQPDEHDYKVVMRCLWMLMLQIMATDAAVFDSQGHQGCILETFLFPIPEQTGRPAMLAPALPIIPSSSGRVPKKAPEAAQWRQWWKQDRRDNIGSMVPKLTS